jgi:hypothetical protein
MAHCCVPELKPLRTASTMIFPKLSQGSEDVKVVPSTRTHRHSQLSSAA